MSKFIGKIKHSWWVSIPSLFGVILAASGSISAWVKLRSVSGPLIIHFSDYSGITQTGSLSKLLAFGAAGTLMLIMNFALAMELDSRDPLFGKIAAATSFFFGGLIFIGFLVIIFANI